MKNVLYAMLVMTAASVAHADGHLGPEGTVLALIEQHWDARNDDDFAGQLDMMTSGVHYHANSSGNFFYSGERATVDELKEALGGTTYDVAVLHPEAISLSDTVVLARYYLEGTLKSEDGNVDNYRTRVSHIWVKEKDGWKSKSWHFSPLHGGGTTLN